MQYLITGGTNATGSFSKTDISPLYARKMPICRNWFGIFILFRVEKDYITGTGRQKDRARAGDLLCCWTVVELGMPMVDLARKFDMTHAAVSYAVQRGESMAKERGLQLEA